eukprot:TRINITY_DN11710_c0_g1_i1.p1 TRINITY_DN11710_c0_g1~~TRINITY_DN11710_c0_g1_i1.p1  ORF type:complete len:323 (+),score=64.71 TRINITY_DN11710_c0_g1_i1:453-1421(+)
MDSYNLLIPSRLLPEPATSTSSSTSTTTSTNTTYVEPAPIGHITLQYFTATSATHHNIFEVTHFPHNPQVSGNPLASVEGLYHRWSNLGTNPDFWLDVEPLYTGETPDYTFSVQKAVYDGRLETFGFIFGTDLGIETDIGGLPPPHHRVAYPLWQGTSTALGPPHDVYFLLLEASDAEFCDLYGCVYAPSLAASTTASANLMTLGSSPEAPSRVNQNILSRTGSGTWADTRATDFHFFVDPGQVPIASTSGDNGYSPLKYFTFGVGASARVVFANMPFIYWGDKEVSTSLPISPLELRTEKKKKKKKKKKQEQKQNMRITEN